MYHINTIPGQAAKENGFTRYPEDFPHLAFGNRFAAWKSGEDWEIETTLDGEAFVRAFNNYMNALKKSSYRPTIKIGRAHV